MLSVRLTSDLERQLDFLAMASGLSKNQMVIAAVEQYLKQQELGCIPLEQKIQEASHETFLYHRKLEEAEGKNAIAVAEWARANGIWTAKLNPSASVTGAIHGRNIVIGYSWSQDDKIMVISKHLPATPNAGAQAYSYYVTSYETWHKHMQLCRPL